MNPIYKELQAIIDGEISTSSTDLDTYSHDASIYEMSPEVVIFPKNTSDIKSIIKFVDAHKPLYPSISITARGAGTDMSGGPLSDSVVLDMTKYFNQIFSTSPRMLHTQPGVFMRDIDPALEAHDAMLGCVPASRSFNTIGGMIANNSAGEQSFRYGNADKTVKEVKIVLRDGKEYTFGPINRKQLEVKLRQSDLEGELYSRIYSLIEKNYDLIKNARPQVHKNSMGYNLWTTWDRETGIFDMSQIITGSQGTLGVITDIKIAAVPKAKHTGLLLAYLTNIKHLDEIIPLVVSHKPATFEGFDDITFNLGVKYFNTFRKQLGTKEWLKQQATLLGSVAKFRGHLPNIVLMVEFEADTYQALNDKIVAMDDDLKKHHIKVRTEIEGNEEMSKPFWQIRRASLTLLRQRVKNKYASSFMDDLAVDPKYVQEFLPEVRKIIKKYKLPATVAGHFGDGNFHIIPLMDITDPREQLKLEPAMRELVPIVLKYKGTLAGEHNDGMVRGPWLPAMFGEEMYQIFKEVKNIFDPMFIFNPHKKTDASWDFSMANIRKNHKRNLYK